MRAREDSNEARMQQLERRFMAPDSGSKSSQPGLDLGGLRLASSHPWPTQTQEISPDAKVHQSDDEEDDDHAFAVINISNKKRKLNNKESQCAQNEVKPRDGSRSASPTAGSKEGKPRIRPLTPLKEISSARTPEKGRKRGHHSAQKNTLQNYFHDRSLSPKLDKAKADSSGSRNEIPQPSVSAHPAETDRAAQNDFAVKEAHWQQERQRLQAELDKAEACLRTAVDKQEATELRMEKAHSDLQSIKEDLQHGDQNLAKLQGAYEKLKQKAAARETQLRNGLLATATHAALSDREVLTARLQSESSRLGNLSLANVGQMGLQEVWEEGDAFKSVQRQHQHIALQKEKIDAARKSLRKKLPPPERFNAANAADDAKTAPTPAGQGRISPEDYITQDEIFKARLTSLKREEDVLQKDRERLEAEKQRHLRELRLVKDEESSQFGCGTVLSNRYLLQKLIGKGGFSEVYQAFDVEQVREVAVKVHQLNTMWTDAKKASYVKHATREFNIHKSLQHPRIVALVDIFELDSNSFATVLELCPNGDLDTHLKQHQVLPEKEARVIISQIFQGLAYLNEIEQRIIHYDLKPGNILFNALGEVKITDFGLSKIAGEGTSQGMDLTSQGAGTYWYLPPETFEVSHQPPKISNKVDVWSAAVILYQMLYGKRPWGEGLTQEAILREDVMLNARQVTFPPKPAVSQECKDFIARCLAYRQKDRVDVLTAAADPYLVLKRPRPTTGSSSPYPKP